MQKDVGKFIKDSSFPARTKEWEHFCFQNYEQSWTKTAKLTSQHYKHQVVPLNSLLPRDTRKLKRSCMTSKSYTIFSHRNQLITKVILHLKF